MTEEYIVRILENDDCITEGELIRCRECKFWKNGGCDFVAFIGQTSPYDFCSWAERRDNDTR